MKPSIIALSGGSLSRGDVGGGVVGRVLRGDSIPASKATTLIGDPIDCLGRTTEFAVLLRST